MSTDDGDEPIGGDVTSGPPPRGGVGALISERDFLLRSIADLDAEHEAGDLEDDDYAALRDGYVARAAAILRQLDGAHPQASEDTGPASEDTGPASENTGPASENTGPASEDTGPASEDTGPASDRTASAREKAAVAESSPSPSQGRIGWKRRALTFAAAGAIAVGAGFALAQAAGYRSPTEASSGGIRQSTSARLAEADTLGAEGRWDEALEVYDSVLQDDPANAEALTYKGWILNTQFGDADQASDLLAEAVAADPTYPDARVFSALLDRNRGDYVSATENLAAFDAIDSVPEQMTMLVDNAALRSEVLAEVYLDEFDRTGAVVIDDRFAIDESARAAVVLDSRGDVVAAIATFDAVLDLDATNRIAQIGLGRRLGATPELVASSPTLAARGLRLLDDAVASDPNDAEARAYRALARATQDDTTGARSDLAILDDTETIPDGLQPIVDELHRWLDE